MIKDYAPSASQKTSGKQKWVACLIIALAIIIPATMYYVKFQKTRSHKSHRTYSTKTQKQQTTAAKQSKNNSTDYDFYTLLPKGAGNP